MKPHLVSCTPLVGKDASLDATLTEDGPALVISYEAKGIILRASLTPEEARQAGIALISLAAMHELAEAEKKAATVATPGRLYGIRRNGLGPNCS